MLDESGSFDPKAVAIMLEAYDGVVVDLRLQAADEREKAARLVMQLARGSGGLGFGKSSQRRNRPDPE
jgi:hypothetical protein